MGKNLEIITSLVILLLAFVFSIWSLYTNSYSIATIMLIIGIINIGYLVKEIKEKRSDENGHD
ncbi:Uncharacterised protein [Mycobacteroides abscessus subsp. abscessus]|jgi:hypothetical protein|uniref:hypothetical protein n=1 Tax=Staphylococcus hominis TaxID=1290 RepID=UPI0009164D2F|nr:hypothetical protein [Staphylococcus hominis]SGW03728.1 Uncharacterised protein [Staphylococcus aureus]SIK44983.1 Uncharacterised protein [Mycobacteroides abscessus subsp. abscessus]